MRLTKPSLQDLKKVSVMIRCRGTESNQGSGTIICVDDTLYVLTAAYVISNSDYKCFEKEKINVVAVKDKDIYTFMVNDVVYFNYEQNCAVLEVSNDNSFPVETLKKVRILKHETNEEGTLSGFGRNKPEVKVYSLKQVSDILWLFLGFDISQQPLSATAIFNGFQGGGVFYKGDSELFLSCYFIGLGDVEGSNNELECYSATNFTVFKPLQKILLDDDNMLPNTLNPSPMNPSGSDIIGREKDLPTFLDAMLPEI